MSCLKLGDTLVFAPGGHLWVVISESSKHGGQYVIVNLTTDLFRAGKECELFPSDHPWITQKSYVTFGDARLVSPTEDSKIATHISSGTIKNNQPMSTASLGKIIAAAKTSKALAANHLQYL